MSTLADEFLKDIASTEEPEDSEDSQEEQPKFSDEQKQPNFPLRGALNSGQVVDNIILKSESAGAAEHNSNPLLPLKAEKVSQIVRLYGSEKLSQIIKRIEGYRGTITRKQFLGDSDPEYELIVTSNEMAAELTHEITLIHKFIRDFYCKKFPELEQLVLHPLDYARVVRRIGNNSSSATIQALSDILPTSNIITISMAASSSTGENLTETELSAVNEACETALKLDENRQKILSYVEGRMQVFAPNLTALVGSEIATKLIGAAGGLLNLATMPSANLFVLGRKRNILDGFSSATTVRHYGYIASSDLVQKSPPALEVKASRLVANKCTLAARLDLSRDDYTQGEMGQRFREEIVKKIEKWMEPPPKQKEKVLPAPDDIPRKRRGGARMRKYKQRYALTETRKRAMRLPFGQITEEVGNSMKSLGMLGMTEGSKVIRVHAREEKGFQPRVPKRKKNQKGNQSTPGFATSVYAMTPFQGLELGPGAAKEKPQDTNDGYFSTTGGFLQVGQKRKTIT